MKRLYKSVLVVILVLAAILAVMGVVAVNHNAPVLLADGPLPPPPPPPPLP